MKTIIVHTPFNIQFQDGSRVHMLAGTHTVEDAVADHWYAKVNSTPVIPTSKIQYDPASRTPQVARK